MVKEDFPLWVLTNKGKPIAAFDEEQLAEEFIKLLSSVASKPEFKVHQIDYWST